MWGKEPSRFYLSIVTATKEACLGQRENNMVHTRKHVSESSLRERASHEELTKTAALEASSFQYAKEDISRASYSHNSKESFEVGVG